MWVIFHGFFSSGYFIGRRHFIEVLVVGSFIHTHTHTHTNTHTHTHTHTTILLDLFMDEMGKKGVREKRERERMYI